MLRSSDLSEVKKFTGLATSNGEGSVVCRFLLFGFWFLIWCLRWGLTHDDTHLIVSDGKFSNFYYYFKFIIFINSIVIICFIGMQ